MKRIPTGVEIILFTLSVLSQLQAIEQQAPAHLADTLPANHNSLADYLNDLGQEHLLEGFETLLQAQKEDFDIQLRQYGKKLLQHQQAILLSEAPEPRSLTPIQKADRAGSLEDRALGEKLIREGKVGCLILAGGQGSRLGINGPKGIINVSPVRQKSLFQLFAEKTLAASAQAGRPLHVAVMTSPLNHAQTTEFFQTQGNFGLNASQLDFFEQSVLPFCDDQGNWILEKPGKLLEGPDGNGNALHLLYHSGVHQKWKEEGIEYVNLVLIDNPLADPFDPELIGKLARTQAETVLKAVARTSVEEKVGVVALDNGHVNVVEYSELKGGDMKAVNPDGTPLFWIANISLFSFHMDFIERIATDPECSLPLHLAHKDASVTRGAGESSYVEKIKAWKYEAFIFDVLPFARSTEILVYPRESCFSPLKNAKGNDSLQTVQDALQAMDKQVYSTLSGLPAPERTFELDPAFYYPTPELIEKWQGKELPEDVSYITP